MTENNLILNRLFTQNVFFNTVNRKNLNTYGTIIQRYISDPENKDNGTLLSEIYEYMANSYRNEYFYQNTLLNKLLLGKHSIKTTAALTQIPIGKSKADFILINGKAVVYEIKTELDSFDRLESQINDYYKAFTRVCVVTSKGQYYHAIKLLNDSPVGVYVLTDDNTISKKLRKEPIEDCSSLSHEAIFKLLHRQEYDNILYQYYNYLPKVSQVFYFDECLKQFNRIPIIDAYRMALNQLKTRNRIKITEFAEVPYELKSLIYFSKISEIEWRNVNSFLKNRYGG